MVCYYYIHGENTKLVKISAACALARTDTSFVLRATPVFVLQQGSCEKGLRAFILIWFISVEEPRWETRRSLFWLACNCSPESVLTQHNVLLIHRSVSIRRMLILINYPDLIVLRRWKKWLHVTENPCYLEMYNHSSHDYMSLLCLDDKWYRIYWQN